MSAQLGGGSGTASDSKRIANNATSKYLTYLYLHVKPRRLQRTRIVPIGANGLRRWVVDN